jgi:hypothetical protein
VDVAFATEITQSIAQAKATFAPWVTKAAKPAFIGIPQRRYPCPYAAWSVQPESFSLVEGDNR